MKKFIVYLLAIVITASLSAQQTILVKKVDPNYKGPRVGVVLSGGGAKGAAHIGVLKYIEEIGIPVSFVTGTSMGSIIGGLYALGYEPQELADIIATADWTRLMSNNIERSCRSSEQRLCSDHVLLSVPFGSGDMTFARKNIMNSFPAAIINSSNILNLFSRLSIGYTDSMGFNKLPIPYACVATDIITGDSVVIHSGPFPLAIRSSMAIPGIFAPVPWGKYLLADGGLVDNFPVDVCKRMGADIVIGVEVAGDLADSADKLRSLPQMLSQYMSLSTKGDRFQHRDMCDVYIHPDVSGFNMLSFSAESIDSLVTRGYREAASHHDDLLAIKNRLEKYGHIGKHLQGPCATKLLDDDSVHLRNMTFHGVSEIELRELEKSNTLIKKDICTVSDLEAFVSSMRGTGYYNNVLYTLRPTGEDGVYDMDVYLTLAKPHRLGFGFRFDNEESASILFHFGYNELRSSGFKGILDLDLCYNFGFNVRLIWAMRHIGDINLDYRFSQYSFNSNNYMASSYSSMQQRMRLYYSNAVVRGFMLKAGVLWQRNVDVDFMRMNNFIDLSDLNFSFPTVGLFASLQYDNRDDAYFPTRGVSMSADGEWRFLDTNVSGKRWVQPYPFYVVRFSLQPALSIGSRFSILPMVGGRFVFNKIADYGYCWYENLVGGAFEGRYLEHLFPFIGVKSPILADPYMGIARLDLRYRVGEKIYLSAMANILYSRDPYYNYFDDPELASYSLHPEKEDMLVQGYGFRVAYKSIMGPIFFDLMWNDITHKMTGYLNIGYYF